ncbi:MAG: hypothetical protein LBH92_08580, partial [Bacteroidales bacterium]|nr:hypothetical protein [Bacteroidales bacterium]
MIRTGDGAGNPADTTVFTVNFGSPAKVCVCKKKQYLCKKNTLPMSSYEHLQALARFILPE